MELEASAIVAAHTRLRGQLVATPLIAGIVLPGRSVSPELRVKVECLQQGGSIYFRGAQHWLMRHYGSLNEMVVHGSFRQVFAAAHAAQLQRTPCKVVLAGQVDADLRSMLDGTGAAIECVPGADAASERAAAIRTKTGATILPGVEADDYALGIATVGLELAQDLGSGVDVVYVAPGSLAEPIRVGLRAGNRSLRVEAVSIDDLADDGGEAIADSTLGSELLCGLRVRVGPAGQAAFAAALHCGQPACAVLAD